MKTQTFSKTESVIKNRSFNKTWLFTNTQSGFTLIELSIVILIMGLLLGGIALPLATQLENGRVRETRRMLAEVETAVEGYALVNGHLPCPATPASNGLAAPSGGSCLAQNGFVPASTLGLSGARNDDNLLLDAWANPLRYSVSAADVDADGNWDFTTPGEMRDVTMSLLAPDLVVCSATAGSSPVACSGPDTTLASAIPAVLYSLGKDWVSFSSADQLENVGASLAGGPSGSSYPIAADNVFVSRQRSERPGEEYDDLIAWSAVNSLYHRLIASGQLP